MRSWLAACGAVVLAGAAAGGIALHIYRAAGPLPHTQGVLVPRAGTARLALALRDAGVIHGIFPFEAAAALTASEGALHGGELEFPAGASLRQVLAVLRTGRRLQHRVTFAEGLTAAQMSRLVAGDATLEGDIEVPPEGALLPETYIYERPASAALLLRRAEQAADIALRDAWQGRAAGLPLHDPREALILASIVERETHLAVERPIVAAVFLNRLRAGMRLQADPTTLYGASGGLGRLDRALTKDDLARDDSYNTYVVPALPSGPICSPGRASLLAVLHPAATDALYFVADGQGGHRFAATLAAHTKNVETYRHLPK